MTRPLLDRWRDQIQRRVAELELEDRRVREAPAGDMQRIRREAREARERLAEWTARKARR